MGENIAGKEDFGMIECFKVMTTLEVVEEMRCEGVATRVTDHSSMHWEVAVDLEGEVKGKAREAVVERRYRVPEGYLDDEVGRVRMLIGQIEATGDDQTAIDDAYGKKKEKRREYVEKRRVYKRAVGKAKGKIVESKRNELENMMRNPREWWNMVRKLGMPGGRERNDIGKVYDEVGVVRQGKEAVEVWRKYFEKVLNDGGRFEVQDEVESDKASDENELMSESLTRGGGASPG